MKNIQIVLSKKVQDKAILSIRLDSGVKKKLDWLCKIFDLSQPEAITQMIESAFSQVNKKI